MVALWELFQNSSSIYRDCKCMIFDNGIHKKILTYLETSNLSDQVHLHLTSLIKRKNYSRIIGIFSTELSPEIIAIVIGIMKGGNTFICVDTKTVINVIKDFDISLLITKEDDGEKSFLQLTNRISRFKLLDTYFEIWDFNSENTTIREDTIDSYAFIACTSGSTGDPKIIKVPHDCIVPNVLHLREEYGIIPDDVLFFSAPLTFDPSILDIFVAFSSGACVYLTLNVIKMVPDKLFQCIFSGDIQITVMSTTPSLFCRWNIDTIKKLTNTSLRILALGGEEFPPSDIHKQWDIFDVIRVYNLYGVTEVSCWAMFCLVNDIVKSHKEVPLGTAINETVIQVRNDAGQEILQGIGEIFIGSNTRICTIGNESRKQNSGTYFHRTNDIAKVENGNYYFRGRKDRIVKIYGRRINLSTVEKTVLKISYVTRCCCFETKKQHISLLLELMKTDEEGCIRRQVKQTIYSELSFIPDDILVVPKIPLNRHGKMCEKSCKDLYENLKKLSSDIIDIKNTFATLWKKYSINFNDNDECAKLEEIGFVDSGGDSVLALQFVAQLTELYDNIPNNLISYFLSNKSFKECFNLIVNSSETRKTNFNNEFVKHSQSSSSISHSLSDRPRPSQTDRPSQDIEYDKCCKKLKLDLGNIVVFQKCRGKTSYYADITKCNIDHYNYSKIEVCWKHYLKKCVDASPSLITYQSGDTVVICGSHSGQVIVVDAESGLLVSSCQLPDRVESSACSSFCGKYFYVGCYDKHVYCVELSSGTIRWCYKTGDIIKCTPVYFKQHIFFGSYDHFLYCIDSEDGHLIWKKMVDDSSIYAAVEICGNELLAIVTLGGSLAVIDLEGNQKYKHFLKHPFFSNPLYVLTITSVIAADVTGILYCCHVQTGDIMWHFQAGGNIFSSIATVLPNSEDEPCKILFGCFDKNLYCLSISHNCASVEWKTTHNCNIYATPFISGNLICSADINGHIYICNVEDGNILFRHGIEYEVFSSPVIHKNNIFIGCRDDFLYCLKLSSN